MNDNINDCERIVCCIPDYVYKAETLGRYVVLLIQNHVILISLCILSNAGLGQELFPLYFHVLSCFLLSVRRWRGETLRAA